MEALSQYQNVEHNNRQKYRDRMARQYRIGMRTSKIIFLLDDYIRINNNL